MLQSVMYSTCMKNLKPGKSEIFSYFKLLSLCPMKTLSCFKQVTPKVLTLLISVICRPINAEFIQLFSEVYLYLLSEFKILLLKLL